MNAISETIKDKSLCIEFQIVSEDYVKNILRQLESKYPVHFGEYHFWTTLGQYKILNTDIFDDTNFLNEIFNSMEDVYLFDTDDLNKGYLMTYGDAIKLISNCHYFVYLIVNTQNYHMIVENDHNELFYVC